MTDEMDGRTETLLLILPLRNGTTRPLYRHEAEPSTFHKGALVRPCTYREAYACLLGLVVCHRERQPISRIGDWLLRRPACASKVVVNPRNARMRHDRGVNLEK